MLGKDWCYNEGDIETLYLLALPRQMDPPLYTIRELNASHLPMLYSIRDNSYATIEKLFGLPRSEIRVFFHYHPTYYHLHVHFCHVKMASKSIQVGRAVFLNDVI
jgi:m7GpppX diphosphatase